jgi:5-methylcytosine-specific restriction endonuclease McrA
VVTDVGEILRAEVSRRAGCRCEYCLIHEDDAGFSHQLDHIISRKHGGTSAADNLALACVLCNRHKAVTWLPSTRELEESFGCSTPGGTAGATTLALTKSTSNR